MESFQNDRASLPRNMIENSMFEEEPDVVDLAKEIPVYPLDPDDVVYEPRSSRLLVRGLGENDLDEEEEDYESSARLLGMSFMNRSSSLRANASPYTRQEPPGSCSMPSARTVVVGVFILVVIASVAMVIYFLPRCTFTKEGCHKVNTTMELIYPISTSGELFPWTKLRLPGNVRPVHYDLLIYPNLTSMTFEGKVSITIEIMDDTSKVVLHASDMEITKAMVQDKEVKILEYKKWQQIAIKLPEELKKGKSCVLTLEYSANLSSSCVGFYNSSYIDKNGIRWVLAATQFEPLGARKAFPCFDEPAFKATFLIKIKRTAGYISLSNMPKNKTIQLADGIFQDEFENSVTMSTYLVAFIVANFTSISKDVSGTLVSVYAVPEKMDQANYALETGAKLLEFYNQFFDIKYPLRKLDLVAIPDFLAGAMENWGLITFRETTLLVGNNSCILDRQLVTMVIAHELAHQWFGNLVTMKWWNDLWLNEGFATYMQYTSVMKVFHDLDIGNNLLSMRFKAMAKDSLNSSHPISATVNSHEQVEEMFDSISYEKGASILLMLNSVMSEEQFRKGVIEYLNKYRNKNAANEDFWNSLSQVAKQPYSPTDMMSWTLQKGFPLVTVSRKGSLVKLSQEQFLQKVDSDNSTAESVSSNLWHIPLTYVNDSCSLTPACKQVLLLKDKTGTLDIPSGVKWLKFNFRSEGFYVVHYGEEGWKDLIGALTSNLTVLTHEDRACLINNIFALSRIGKVSFRHVLSLLEYLENETETAPLVEALSQLNHIYRLLEKKQDLHLVARMKSYIFNLFGNLMDNQVWEEGLSVSQKQLRSTLLELACSFKRQNCTDNAERIFEKWVASNGTERIPGDLMKTVFSVGTQTESGWVSLLEAYRYSKVDAEKRKMLHALASTQNILHIVWLMKASLEGSIVQIQELPLVLSTICKNFLGHLYAWDFLKENWGEIAQRFPMGSFPMQSIITSTTYEFSSKVHLLEVQNFFGSLKERGSQLRSVQEAMETIKLNIQWMDNNLETLRVWL